MLAVRDPRRLHLLTDPGLDAHTKFSRLGNKLLLLFQKLLIIYLCS